MNLFSWGLVLLFFNINIGPLSLLPGWVGYLLLTLVGSGAAIAALIVALVALVLYILAFQNSYHIWEAGRQTEE